ncbi:MAG: DUF1700 domain-containing protein [Ruminococcus sp.]|nr:DUF1700 domain-containing protein [Ruminococcus sp.]
MKRIEFITELSRKLYKLPKEELESVLSYYDEIFLDAGIENEEETAEKLGNIDDIIRQILVENNIEPDGKPEYYVDSSKQNQQKSNTYQPKNESSDFNNKPKSGMSAAAKILIAVLTFPIWLPVLIVIVSLAFALLVTVIAVAFAFAVAGVSCIVVGIITLFTAPPIGLTTLGIGFVFLGIIGLIASPILKAVFNSVRNVLNSIFSFLHNIIDRRRAV